jgi:hypothetical protein
MRFVLDITTDHSIPAGLLPALTKTPLTAC